MEELLAYEIKHFIEVHYGRKDRIKMLIDKILENYSPAKYD